MEHYSNAVPPTRMMFPAYLKAEYLVDGNEIFQYQKLYTTSYVYGIREVTICKSNGIDAFSPSKTRSTKKIPCNDAFAFRVARLLNIV